MNTARALKLADHLDTQVETEKFDMGVWWRMSCGTLACDAGCGYVGCAMGHACTIFPEFLYIDNGGVLRFKRGEEKDTRVQLVGGDPEARNAIIEFFEIGNLVTCSDLEWKFTKIFFITDWHMQGWINLKRDPNGIFFWERDMITPKMVAAKIREVVAEIEAQALIEASQVSPAVEAQEELLGV